MPTVMCEHSPVGTFSYMVVPGAVPVALDQSDNNNNNHYYNLGPTPASTYTHYS